MVKWTIPKVASKFLKKLARYPTNLLANVVWCRANRGYHTEQYTHTSIWSSKGGFVCVSVLWVILPAILFAS